MIEDYEILEPIGKGKYKLATQALIIYVLPPIYPTYLSLILYSYI